MGYNHLDDFCKLEDDTKEHYLRKGSNNHGYVKPGEQRDTIKELVANNSTIPSDPFRNREIRW